MFVIIGSSGRDTLHGDCALSRMDALLDPGRPLGLGKGIRDLETLRLSVGECFNLLLSPGLFSFPLHRV